MSGPTGKKALVSPQGGRAPHPAHPFSTPWKEEVLANNPSSPVAGGRVSTRAISPGLDAHRAQRNNAQNPSFIAIKGLEHEAKKGHRAEHEA